MIRNNLINNYDVLQVKQLLDNTLSKSTYQVIYRDDNNDNIMDRNIIYVYHTKVINNELNSPEKLKISALPQIKSHIISSGSPNKNSNKNNIINNNTNNYNNTNIDGSMSKLLLKIDMNETIITKPITSTISADDNITTTNKEYIYTNINNDHKKIRPLTTPNIESLDIWGTSDEQYIETITYPRNTLLKTI